MIPKPNVNTWLKIVLGKLFKINFQIPDGTQNNFNN